MLPHLRRLLAGVFALTSLIASRHRHSPAPVTCRRIRRVTITQASATTDITTRSRSTTAAIRMPTTTAARAMATATSRRLLPAVALVHCSPWRAAAARPARAPRAPAARQRPSPGCDPPPRRPTGGSAGCHPEQLTSPTHPAGARFARTRAPFLRPCWDRTTASEATSTRRPGQARRRWPTGTASAPLTTPKRATATSSPRPQHRACAFVRERVHASSTGTRPRPARAIERSPASSAARGGPRWSSPPRRPPTGLIWRRNSSAPWPASRPESATAPHSSLRPLPP